MSQFIVGAICFAAGLFSGVLIRKIDRYEPNNEMEVKVIAGRSREQSCESGNQYNEVKRPPYYTGRIESPGSYQA